MISGLQIRSSWIVGNGDCIEVGARRANGKKITPRKKRGKPITDAVRADNLAKVAAARERRRCGFEVSSRS